VSAFSLVARTGDTVDLVYRDDEEPTEGAGGRVVRVGIRGEGLAPPVVLVPSGAGHGAPEAMSASWLVYSDTADHARLLSLDKTASAEQAGRPSTLEPSLDDGRLLSASATSLSVLYPREKDAPVRVVSCVP
jgi:hypothetical protein